VADALAILRSIRSQGVHGSDAEVSFGHVVNCPLPPQQPLAVVQPQEGGKVVSDANTRYEFELWSGTVIACSSEALQPSSNPLAAALRLVWRRPPCAAVHELVVQAPNGSSRTFRVGTTTADVPAQRGERVTIVCAPNKGANKLQRLVLTTSPPGTQPGQPMLIANHATGAELPLLRPPLPGTQATLPGWLLPAAVLLAGGDAASGLLDPALPLLIAGSVSAVAASAVVSNTLLVPSLKKLPVKAVTLESIRQQLLGQHARLEAKVRATLQVRHACVQGGGLGVLQHCIGACQQRAVAGLFTPSSILCRCRPRSGLCIASSRRRRTTCARSRACGSCRPRCRPWTAAGPGARPPTRRAGSAWQLWQAALRRG
jgi:hypothetical protein